MQAETDVEWLICTKKKAFRSQAEARRHARDNKWRWGAQWAYKCKVCGHVHLTSKDPRRNRQAENVQDSKTGSM